MVNKCHYELLDVKDIAFICSPPGLIVYWEVTVETLHKSTCKVIRMNNDTVHTVNGWEGGQQMTESWGKNGIYSSSFVSV